MDQHDWQRLADFLHNREILRETALFAETGRPIHAWRAYYWIRQVGLPVPPWFLEYLDECAERCVDSCAQSPDEVAALSGMGRKGRNATIASRQLAVVEYLVGLRQIHPDASLQELLDQAAQACGVATTYARDAYYKWFRKI